jgi:hypothetical protein
LSRAEGYAADDPELARLLASELVATYELLEQALPLALRALTAPPGGGTVPIGLTDHLWFWATLLTLDERVFLGGLETWIADQPTAKPSPLQLRGETLETLCEALRGPRPAATV